MKIEVALFDAYFEEVIYSGYCRQQVSFTPAHNGQVSNYNEVRFPTYSDAGHITVYYTKIYVDDVIKAEVPLTRSLTLSLGVAPSFLPGSLAITESMLNEEAVKGVIPEYFPLPTNCEICNYHNAYIGPEHLNSSGHYICRSCK